MFQHQGRADSPLASGPLGHVVGGRRGDSEDAFRSRRGRRRASQKRVSPEHDVIVPISPCCFMPLPAVPALVSILVVSSIMETSGAVIRSLTLCPRHVPVCHSVTASTAHDRITRPLGTIPMAWQPVPQYPATAPRLAFCHGRC